jgi:hypothetical protein
MIKEVNLSGIYVAPFAAYLFCALLIYVPVWIFLDRIEIQKWAWHRQLFEAAIFLIVLSLIGIIWG